MKVTIEPLEERKVIIEMTETQAKTLVEAYYRLCGPLQGKLEIAMHNTEKLLMIRDTLRTLGYNLAQKGIGGWGS